MTGWIERYRAGDHVQGWAEMTGPGPDLRNYEDAWAEAMEVTRETMRRARTNVERLLELLPARDYEFDTSPGLHVYVPPADFLVPI